MTLSLAAPRAMTTSTRTVDSVFGLKRPTLAEAQQSADRVYGSAAPEIWANLLHRAGLSGNEQDTGAVQRIAETAERSDDPVVALYGAAQAIRVLAYDRLTVTDEILSGYRG